MTADEPRLRVTTNLAFGICLILVGTALMLDRLQLVDAAQIFRFWPVALMLFGAALVIQSFQRVDPVQTRSQQGFDGGHIFALIIFAVIMSQVFNRGGFTARADSSETVNLFAVMTHHQQVSSAAVFRGGEMTAVMGHSDLDLRRTTIAPGEEAVIEVFTLMGGTTIRVPEGWSVDVRAFPIAGGVKDRRSGARDIPGSPRIVIRGFIMMGGLNIRS
jgi:cell wall-active antibiotic response 4TMS protein YvqF